MRQVRAVLHFADGRAGSINCTAISGPRQHTTTGVEVLAFREAAGTEALMVAYSTVVRVEVPPGYHTITAEASRTPVDPAAVTPDTTPYRDYERIILSGEFVSIEWPDLPSPETE